jgi:hypothetical protein
MSTVDPAKLKAITVALKEQAIAQNNLNKANTDKIITQTGTAVIQPGTTGAKPVAAPVISTSSSGSYDFDKNMIKQAQGSIMYIDALFIDGKRYAG